MMHVPVDPLFLVIPLILSLTSSATHFQPLSDLIAQASVHPGYALPEPFSKEPVKAGWNEDVARLLALKGVRRVFKACCDRKGQSSVSRCHPAAKQGRAQFDEKSVVPAAPPSPNSDGGSTSVSGQRYYRPSRELLISHLKRKVEHFAAPEQYEKFDHLVRGLSRDGLFESGSSADLGKRESLLSRT